MRINIKDTLKRMSKKDMTTYSWIFSGKYIFIRYNPDKFVDKYKVSKNPYLQTRMEVLENVINKHIERIQRQENADLVEVHHVFYDEI